MVSSGVSKIVSFKCLVSRQENTAGWPTCPSSLQFTKQQSEGGEGRTHLQGLSRRSERIRDIVREGLENSRHDKSDGLLNRGWNSQLRKSN